MKVRVVYLLISFLQASAFALSPDDVPTDTPISSLLSSAKSNLAQGDSLTALTYFDLAITRDPTNYLALFQRGATYLSLGRNAKAIQDFNRVLELKPDFEGALLQRARLEAKNAEWDSAKRDYAKAGVKSKKEIEELEEAQGAATLAVQAEQKGDWEACVGHAGVAIMTATMAVELRRLRARCRFERGEIQEGVSDLQHVLQLSPQSTEPHLEIASMLFYSLADTEQALAQIRKCLHSDPDNRSCSRLYRREKSIDKRLHKLAELKEKKQYTGIIKQLTGEQGLIDEIDADVKDARQTGTIHKNSPNGLYDDLVELACEAFYSTNNHKRADDYCKRVLTTRPTSLYGLLSKARAELSASSFEAAIRTLQTAREHHESSSPLIDPLLQKAQIGLKRASQKDYYAVLGVSSDADERTIKKAYRALTKRFHPDKAVASGEMSKEEAETKMASINEAYEVLSDPELRARFDRGDDPNSPEAQGNPFQQGGPFPFGGAGGQQFVFRHGGSGGQGQQFKFNFPGQGFPGQGFHFPF